MSIKTKTAAVVAGLIIASVALTGCQASEYEQRKEAQKSTQMTNSLELENLKKKRDREEDPNAIRYVYVMSFGKIVGYYVSKGKISSNGSQMGPETEVVKSYGDGYVVDSAQDDGSFGSGDPGIFFFTTDGVMVVTSLDYLQSDQPLAVDVPRLSK